MQGHTPEEIVQQYTTLSLADTYGAIAYYHQHRDQVEEYLRTWEERGDCVRQKLEDAGIAVDLSIAEMQERES